MIDAGQVQKLAKRYSILLEYASKTDQNSLVAGFLHLD